MARIGKPIRLSLEQKEQLLSMSRSRKLEKRYVERAEVIYCPTRLFLMDEIVEQTRLSRSVVNKWRQRFRTSGIAGLKDAPGSGKPKGGYTNWSQARIAREVGINQSKVFQILSERILMLWSFV